MPELVLVLFGCLALVLDVLLPRRRQHWTLSASLGGAGLAALSLLVVWSKLSAAFPRYGLFGAIVVDGFAVVVQAVVLLALAVSLALSVACGGQERRGASCA